MLVKLEACIQKNANRSIFIICTELWYKQQRPQHKARQTKYEKKNEHGNSLELTGIERFFLTKSHQHRHKDQQLINEVIKLRKQSTSLQNENIFTNPTSYREYPKYVKNSKRYKNLNIPNLKMKNRSEQRILKRNHKCRRNT